MMLTTMIQTASRPFPGRNGFGKWFRRETSPDPGTPLWCSHALKRAISHQKRKFRRKLGKLKTKIFQRELQGKRDKHDRWFVKKAKAEERVQKWERMWYRWKMVRHWWDVLNSKTQKQSPSFYFPPVLFVRNRNHEDAYDGVYEFAKACRRNFLYACCETVWAKELYNGFRYMSGDCGDSGEHCALNDHYDFQWKRESLKAATKLWNAFKKEAGPDYRKDFTASERAWLDVMHSTKYSPLWGNDSRNTSSRRLMVHKGWYLRVQRPIPKIDFTVPRPQMPGFLGVAHESEFDPLGWPNTQLENDVRLIAEHLRIHDFIYPAPAFRCEWCRSGRVHESSTGPRLSWELYG